MYSSLNDLISCLEYKTKLHIGVVLLGNHGNDLLQLPYSKSIHASLFCDEMKKDPKRKKRCYRCRIVALQKAIQTQVAFEGLCAHGVYEYTHPLTLNGDTVCVIYIGNIFLKEQSFKIEKRLKSRPELIQTLETDFDVEKCKTLAKLIESYILMILDMSPEKYQTQSCNQLIENIKQYIQNNIEYNITLALVAQLFHYNEKYLGRLFHEYEGMSFHQYINHKRLSYAKELLKTTQNDILNIALQVGFQNVTYFNRVFKKIMGVPPVTYRKEIAKIDKI